MRSLFNLLALAYITAQASGVVLPRSRQPCHHHEPSGELVDEYIVKLRPHHTLDDHFQNIGIDLSKEGTSLFSRLEGLNAYRARLTEEFVHSTIRFDPAVQLVERGVIIPPHQSNDTYHGELQDNNIEEEFSALTKRRTRKWNPVSRKGYYLLQYLTAGKKTSALDSGIRLSHKKFGGRASNFRGQDSTEYPWDSRVPADDFEGHGTHVAGLSGGREYGVAQWANLINVKVGCNDEKFCSGSSTGIADAINAITEEHKKKKNNFRAGWRGSIINMSLGTTFDAFLLNEAIDKAFDAGIPIAVAAGNCKSNAKGNDRKAEGTLCLSKNTICVGATNRNYKKSDISRGGKGVDIWAPGDGIYSAGIEHDLDVAWY